LEMSRIKETTNLLIAANCGEPFKLPPRSFSGGAATNGGPGFRET
jgi:hypothetical protein